MAWKQSRGAQISRLTRIAFLLALAALFAAQPLWAQQKSKAPAKGAPKTQAKGPGKNQTKAAEPETAAIDREMAKTQGALESIKAELERGRARYKELQSEEGNYLSRLEQLEKNISASGRYMELVQSRIDSTEKTLALLGDSLVKAEADLRNAREQMKRRLRSAQMTGEVSMLQMLLTAKSPTEFIHRVRYFQDLNLYDKRLAETIRANIASVSRTRTSQEGHREELVKLLADKRKEQQALVEEDASRRVVLEDIRTRKESFAAMVAEFEEAQRELDAIIKVLEERKRKAIEEEERRKRLAREEEERRALVSFERRRGKLPWPVSGEVITKYGSVVHPVYKTVIMNNGIDIAAKKGTPVRSVASGVVAHVNSMRGLGRFVIVDHSGGFMTIYGNLDEVFVKLDQELTVASEIGTVGETGTAGGPKLHFEIRKSAETLDPEVWLEK